MLKPFVSIDIWFIKQNTYRKWLKTNKDWSKMKMTKVFSKISLIKSSKNNFIFLSAFYLIICPIKAPKNFGKIAILKSWDMFSLGGPKTHFGKIALK